MRPSHYTHQIAGELLGEIHATGQDAAGSLQLPSDGHGNVAMGHKAYVDLGRRQSFLNPNHLQERLDQLAPQGATLPSGVKFRSPSGVRNFHAYVRAVRPDVYGRVTGDWGRMKSELNRMSATTNARIMQGA